MEGERDWREGGRDWRGKYHLWHVSSRIADAADPEMHDTSDVRNAGVPKGAMTWKSLPRRMNKGYPAGQRKRQRMRGRERGREGGRAGERERERERERKRIGGFHHRQVSEHEMQVAGASWFVGLARASSSLTGGANYLEGACCSRCR